MVIVHIECGEEIRLHRLGAMIAHPYCWRCENYVEPHELVVRK